MRIYYDTKTGNVGRFINKLKEVVDCECIKIRSRTKVDKSGHLVTFTTNNGEVPELTEAFIKNNAKYIMTVSSSGNRNWGKNFGKAALLIKEEYNIPILMLFELSGTNLDVKEFIHRVYEIN